LRWRCFGIGVLVLVAQGLFFAGARGAGATRLPSTRPRNSVNLIAFDPPK